MSRYATPGERYPQPSPVTLERLLWSWETLRELDLEGYRTSSAEPMSTWLVEIDWADGRVSSVCRGRGTTCSPFTTQSVAMAYAKGDQSPFSPVLANGEPLPILFCLSANSNLKPAHQALMSRYGMTLADNGWPRAAIFFNMARAIDPTEMRRGDAVHIDWMNGGGHAVFCWDVHLDQDGRVDAFQFVSANGTLSNGGTGAGVSVGGTPLGSGGFICQVGHAPARYQALRQPLFVDDDRYVAEGTWVTWKPDLRLRDLSGCRVTPRGHLALAKTVLAARFHGVVPPPPYAMGGQDATCEVHVPEVRPVAVPVSAPPPEPVVARQAEGSATSGQLWVEQRLKMLYEIGLLDADPGDPDSVNDAQTQAAARAFQKQQGLKVDGIVGPMTRARLREVYEQAAQTPAGQRYLATGQGTRGEAAEAEPEPTPLPEARTFFYFRHGTAAPGQEVAVVLRGGGDQALPLRLRDLDHGQVYDTGVSLSPENGVARARISVPADVPAGARLAAVAGEHETPAPLYVAGTPLVSPF